jgi:hypothetical protein
MMEFAETKINIALNNQLNAHAASLKNTSGATHKTKRYVPMPFLFLFVYARHEPGPTSLFVTIRVIASVLHLFPFDQWTKSRVFCMCTRCTLEKRSRQVPGESL